MPPEVALRPATARESASPCSILLGYFTPYTLNGLGLGPKYIADLLTEYKPNRPLRSLGSSQLEIPRVHTKQGESAFSYYAARS